MNCATPTCPAPATVYLTARGGLGSDIAYRAAATCDRHRRQHRSWVARAGPAVVETPVSSEQELETLF